MAILQVNFKSNSLMRNVPIQVILTVDKQVLPGTPVRENKPYKTLYLLHGIYRSCFSWLSESRIHRWAEERNLAVVMPSGDNALYVDQPLSGNLYGGFGAIRNGLKYSEIFGSVAALSSALILDQTLNLTYNATSLPSSRAYFESCFGDLNEALKGDKNLKVLVKLIKDKLSQDSSTPIPKIYLTCGTEDFLIKNNRDFIDFLIENQIDVTYEEGPGYHD